ncbi:MAG: DUF1566 domain-containing protein, partial [Candidatus Auribacterota bacterium]|nr:DUF1566 domain-containing protein [Candidatus Auribacterota bacterium]
GDDGAIQAGYPANPGGRFVDNEDGTVSDRATGLRWQINDSAFLPVGPYRGYLSWEEAFEYVREMNIRHVGGFSNWRLPNYFELHSLFDFSQFYPAVDPLFKYSIQSDRHWSSSSRNHSPADYHWAINFTNGHGTFYEGSTTSAYVMAVMGGPGQPIGEQVTTPTPGYGPTPEWGPTPIPGPTPPPVYHLYYGLPPTGQTAIYHSAGSDDMGDDGVTRIGYPAAGAAERWEDTGYGTVIDWATGLMWQKSCSEGEIFGGLSGVITWEEGFLYVAWMNHANYGGYSDWRIPNGLELLSTRDLAKGLDCYPELFADTTSDPYWSSTCPSREDANQAFRMSYSYGEFLPASLDLLSGVRACRSFYDGISPIGFPRTGKTQVIHPAGWYDLGDDGANQAGFPTDGERYTDNRNGTVTDNATGLIWQQGCNTAPVTWNEAFNCVKDLNQRGFGDHSDWRLPNQMELFSIIDFGNFYPAVNSVFTGTLNDNFWSSTSSAHAPTTNAWAVNFGTAVGDTYPKTNNFYVRAVRGDPVIPGPRPSPTPDYDHMVFGSGDYNGDGISDIAIFRGTSGLWAVRGVTRTYFGSGSDIPAPGDYNGDGTADVGIFRAESGLWAIRGVTRTYFGSSSDTPIPGDYNGDGKCDTAIFRAGSGLWAIKGVTRVYFGGSADQPVPGDYNGDNTVDLAIFRSSSGLWALRSLSRIYFGGSQDMAIPGNYNTAPGWEVGIFRSASGLWAIRNATRTYFGSGSDLPVPADYTGNTMDDIGIFRSSSGLWAIKSVSRVYFGSGSDTPVTR